MNERRNESNDEEQTLLNVQKPKLLFNSQNYTIPDVSGKKNNLIMEFPPLLLLVTLRSSLLSSSKRVSLKWLATVISNMQTWESKKQKLLNKGLPKPTVAAVQRSNKENPAVLAADRCMVDE